MCDNHHEHGHCHSHETALIDVRIRVLAAITVFVLGLLIDLSSYAKFIVFLTAYIIAGGDVLFKALKNIFRGKVFDENFLMGIATIGAFAIREYPEAVMVMILYQIGEYLQDKAVEKSKDSITQLMDIRPDYANIEADGKIIQKTPSSINIGDTIVVRTGEKIPLDGTVIDGTAFIDTSALTGESIPRQITINDKAISGCINTNGVIKIRVEKAFGESTVSKILELVEHASSKKAKAENFITKFARYYTPAVVIGAVMLALVPPLLFGGGFEIWLSRALTFLVISCPCALVISVPLTFFAGIGGASKKGILVKGSSYLEALSKPYAVVFDKTGTLTKGTFSVSRVVPCNNVTEQELIEYTAMAENYSNHPIAVSLKQYYAREIDTSLIKNVQEIAGNGVSAYVNNHHILAGNAALMERFDIAYKKVCEEGTTVYVAKDGQYIGYIVISDEIKDDSKVAICELKPLVDQTYLLTGDTQNATEAVANKLGIGKAYTGLLPVDKVAKLEEIMNHRQSSKSVIFVGDGINDAPVLTRADVGIAMGALGSDAAIEAADVVIMDDQPSKIPTAIKIAQKTMAIVKQNIAFAIGVKIVFLILGAAGFITMWGAVFADVGVTLIAVINSLRALRV